MRQRTTTLGLSFAVTLVAGGCAIHRVPVQQFGNMHDVLSGGGENAKGLVEVRDVLDKPHAYGVGALAGLRGEITICDGVAWAARPSGKTLRVDDPSSATTEKAALLTVAHVDEWRSVTIDRPLAGDALEKFIGEQAAAAGIDPKNAFPFVIDGWLTDLQVHVINGECPMRPGVKLTAAQQPWRFAAERSIPATVVGFYAEDAVGKLTHPGTRLHAHALFDADGRDVTGHIERLAVAQGAVLKLPAAR